MQFVVLHNPRSGRGRAARVADALGGELARRGHTVKRLSIGGAEALDAGKLASADALIVAGGDGSVSRAAAACVASGTPLYHAPTGNENLFARALGMSRDAGQIADDLERAPCGLVDLGEVNAGPIGAPAAVDSAADSPAQRASTNVKIVLIMLSAGPDAGVIRRVAATRTRATGHAAYVLPVAAEVFAPALPRMSCTLDGRVIAADETGILIIANMAEYALRLNPARGSRIDDGRLTGVFFPCRSVVGGLAWLARCATRRDLERAGARVASAERARIEIGAPSAWQIDGEWPRSSTAVPDRSVTLDMRVRAGVLPVVLPGRVAAGY